MGCIITNLHCQLSEYVFISADEMFTFMCCDSRDGNIELKRNASYGAANPAALEDNDYQYVVHVREDNLWGYELRVLLLTGAVLLNNL